MFKVDFQAIKLPCAALEITIIISLLISILITTIMVFIGRENQHIHSFRVKANLQNDVEAIQTYILTDTILPSTVENTFPFQLSADSSELKREWWGLFPLASVSVNKQTKSLKRSFMYGSQLSGFTASALYLTDHELGVFSVGNTTVTGSVFLPKRGIAEGNIEGKGFTGKQLVHGEVKPSFSELPQISPITLTNLKNLFDHRHVEVNINQIYSSDSLKGSYSGNTTFLCTDQPVRLEGIHISGKFIIHSDKEIVVASDCSLDNVILISPSIVFEQGFKGSIQAFASEQILVKQFCKLNYPSVLTIIPHDESLQAEVILEKGSIVEGVVSLFNINKSVHLPQITIDKHALVYGLVYANGYLNLQGSVYGTVATDYFRYKTWSGIYDNYLVDAEINNTRLSASFLIPPLFQTDNFKIVQWLQ